MHRKAFTMGYYTGILSSATYGLSSMIYGAMLGFLLQMVRSLPEIVPSDSIKGVWDYYPILRMCEGSVYCWSKATMTIALINYSAIISLSVLVGSLLIMFSEKRETISKIMRVNGFLCFFLGVPLFLLSHTIIWPDVHTFGHLSMIHGISSMLVSKKLDKGSVEALDIKLSAVILVVSTLL